MAGVMALLKQEHPTWSVEQLKALAMNTAGSDIFSQFGQTGPKYNPGRVGSGRVQVPSALASGSIAYNADGSGSVSVSFGDVEVAGTYSAQRTIRVENHGGSAQSYTLSYDARSSIPGVSYSFPGGVAERPGGRLGHVRRAARRDRGRDAEHARRDGRGRAGREPAAVAERGLRPRAGDAGLRLGTAGARVRRGPRRRRRRAEVPERRQGHVGEDQHRRRGRQHGCRAARLPLEGERVRAGITSGKATLGTGVSELARGADVQYAGAARKGNTLYFGVATHADWAAPATDVQFTVDVDRDGNGTVDFSAFTTRFTFGPNADPQDVFVVAGGSPAAALGFTNVFNSNVNTAPYNNSVLSIPVPVASLGLPAGATSIKYRIVGFSRFWGTIDTTPWATYNVATPGLTFSDGLAATTMYPALDGQKIDVGYNDAVFTANGSGGVLLLHHFNQSGERAEVLSIKK